MKYLLAAVAGLAAGLAAARDHLAAANAVERLAPTPMQFTPEQIHGLTNLVVNEIHRRTMVTHARDN